MFVERAALAAQKRQHVSPAPSRIHTHAHLLLCRPCAPSAIAVSRSEEGQQKRLLVLDADWQQQEEIPLDFGQRFWTMPSLAEGAAAIQKGALRAGDRVRWVA